MKNPLTTRSSLACLPAFFFILYKFLRLWQRTWNIFISVFLLSSLSLSPLLMSGKWKFITWFSLFYENLMRFSIPFSAKLFFGRKFLKCRENFLTSFFIILLLFLFFCVWKIYKNLHGMEWDERQLPPLQKKSEVYQVYDTAR